MQRHYLSNAVNLKDWRYCQKVDHTVQKKVVYACAMTRSWYWRFKSPPKIYFEMQIYKSNTATVSPLMMIQRSPNISRMPVDT